MKYLIILLFPLMMNSQSNFDKAENYFKQSKLDLAQPLFEKFLKDNPTDFKTLEYLGDIQGKLEHWDKALFYYKKLKVLNPKNADYQFKFGGVLGMKAKNANKFVALTMVKDVKTSFENAIKLNPRHIEARYALIELYMQLPAIIGGSERKARKYSDELLTLSPVDGYLSKGRIEEYFENFSKAQIQYKKAYEIGNSKIALQKLNELKKFKNNIP